MISGPKGIAEYLNDVTVVERTEKELMERIECLLKRITDYGFHLRLGKWKFILKSIKCIGFIFDKVDRHPDPERIQTIVNIPFLTGVQARHSFLGLISFYGIFYLPCMKVVGDWIVSSGKTLFGIGLLTVKGRFGKLKFVV